MTLLDRQWFALAAPVLQSAVIAPAVQRDTVGPVQCVGRRAASQFIEKRDEAHPVERVGRVRTDCREAVGRRHDFGGQSARLADSQRNTADTIDMHARSLDHVAVVDAAVAKLYRGRSHDDVGSTGDAATGAVDDAVIAELVVRPVVGLETGRRFDGGTIFAASGVTADNNRRSTLMIPAPRNETANRPDLLTHLCQ